MRLKDGVNIADFLRQAQQCTGDVQFLTTEGDKLNLKSALCRYLFVAVSENEKIMSSSWISCENDADYRLLNPFLLSEDS